MDTKQILATLEKHLGKAENVEIILLKGHMVIEQILNELLSLYIKEENDLEKLNLTFSKKLELLKALEKSKGFSNRELNHLNELNRIRNKLAHKLDFDDYHDDLKKWACTVVGYTPLSINRKRTYINTLKKAFYLLSGYLSASAKVRKEFKQGQVHF